MTSERIFNIFIYFYDGVATEYGVRHCRMAGDDVEKTKRLKSLVEKDFGRAKRFPLDAPLTTQEWLARQRIGLDRTLFGAGLDFYRAPHNPVMCLTAIRDGAVAIDRSVDFASFQGEKIGEGQFGQMEDWLEKYSDGKNFHFDRLLHDDYFVAIKLLLNGRHMASAAKLLMSCIDTLAFVEYGDTSRNFAKWLDSFVNLERLGITSAELWEFRNSVIHMTNLSSRAVLAGKVPSLLPYLGSDNLAARAGSETQKPFNLHGLVVAVAEGIGRWGSTYNVDSEKFAKFVERYDTVISDSRFATFPAESDAG